MDVLQQQQKLMGVHFPVSTELDGYYEVTALASGCVGEWTDVRGGRGVAVVLVMAVVRTEMVGGGPRVPSTSADLAI